MAKTVLLSAQLVPLPWIVNGAIVVMQSQIEVGLPCADTDRRKMKQFSVFVHAASIRLGKSTLGIVVKGGLVAPPVGEGGASRVAGIGRFCNFYTKNFTQH